MIEEHLEVVIFIIMVCIFGAGAAFLWDYDKKYKRRKKGGGTSRPRRTVPAQLSTAAGFTLPNVALFVDEQSHPSTTPSTVSIQPLDVSPPSPTLPSNISLRTIMGRIPRDHLAYGILTDGEILAQNIFQPRHDLAVGDNGSGKTEHFHMKLAQLHYLVAQGHKIQLFATDYKRELRGVWGRSPLLAGRVGIDTNDAIEILNHFVNGPDGIKERMDLFERTGVAHNRIIRNAEEYYQVTGERLAIKIFALDEINTLLRDAAGKSKDGRERGALVESLLKDVLQLGRASWHALHAGAQYITAEVFDREGTKQFINRVVFGTWDTIAINMMFAGLEIVPSVKGLVTGQPGRGIIKSVNHSAPVAIQSFRCDEATILDAIESVRCIDPDNSFVLTSSQPTIEQTQVPSSSEKTPAIVAQEAEELGNLELFSPISPVEEVLITAGLNAGLNMTDIAKSLKGNYDQNRAKVKAIKARLEATQKSFTPAA